MTDDDLVLRAEHLSVVYDGPRPTRAVRDVGFALRRGELLGIAGESGCGKSTLAYAVGRMLRPPARLTGGRVVHRGRDGTETDVLALEGEALRAFRWSTLSIVFQSAMNALNPVTTVGRQFEDIFRAHRPAMRGPERRERARALLDMVGIDPARVRAYPHELSGGMRQRVVIAMALALEPEIVIMDEPTTALDVVAQREILDEVQRLRDELGFSVVFITHDLSLLLEISDRLAVMYAGSIVEHGPAERIARPAGRAERTPFGGPAGAGGSAGAAGPAGPAHPYTQGLLRSFPDLAGERRTLRGIPGSPPDLRDDLPGCPFAPRCDHAFAPCATDPPRLLPVAPAGSAACHLAHAADPSGAPGGAAPSGPPGPASPSDPPGPAAPSGPSGAVGPPGAGGPRSASSGAPGPAACSGPPGGVGASAPAPPPLPGSGGSGPLGGTRPAARDDASSSAVPPGAGYGAGTLDERRRS